jgi:prepilin-type processing-associated H-X9-DG protein
LVELLVVIGIIAILVAILLPAISRARDQANTTACAANMRSLGQLIENYKSEWKGSFPYSLILRNVPGGQPGSVGDGGSNNSDRGVFVWWSVLRRFMKNGKFANYDNFVDFAAERFMQAFNCPSGQRRDAGCDFGSNQLVMPAAAFEFQQGATVPAEQQLRVPARAGQVKPDVVIMWDATEIPPNYNTQYVTGFNVDGGIHGLGIAGGSLRFSGFRFFRGQAPNGDAEVSDDGIVKAGPNIDGAGEFWEGNIRWRHSRNKSANFLFGDGSVRTITIPKLSDPTNPNSIPTAGELRRRQLRPTAPSGFRPPAI